MRRFFCVSGCLCFFTVACDKPVPNEIVKPVLGNAPAVSSFADGSVVRNLFDAGLDGGSDESVDVTGPEDDVRFTKAALLAAAANCARDHLKALRATLVSLGDASARWAKDRTDTNRADEQGAFHAALSELQIVEAMMFGPGARSTSLGGQNLGDKLYTPFPGLDRCALDRQLALGKIAAEDIASAPARQRGLSAFEYLAYYVGADNACKAESDINMNGSWDALDAEELAQRRADFAVAIVADVLAVTDEIITAWGAKGKNFYAEITQPGGKLFADEQAALNTVSDAMFYLEIDVKDVKLGRILNRNGTICQTLTCPEALEAPLSEQSGQSLVSNLAGFRDLFQGCAAGNRGLGFDDWLDAVGATETKTRALAALSTAEAAVAAVLSLETALSTDPDSVMSAYTAIKQLTDLLKVELKSTLRIEPPKGPEGDND